MPVGTKTKPGPTPPAPSTSAPGSDPLADPLAEKGFMLGAADTGRSKYAPGTHGAKGREQKRLESTFGQKVSGSTHESEHPIGNSVLIETADAKRGKNQLVKDVENHAPAYQEYKQLHRDHINTGSNKTGENYGFDHTDKYREHQRAALLEGNAGNAVQLNQLDYAFNPEFKNKQDDVATKQANSSFVHMVNNMKSLGFVDDGEHTTIDVSADERAEMIGSRIIAKGLGEGPGGYLSPEQITKIRELI